MGNVYWEDLNVLRVGIEALEQRVTALEQRIGEQKSEHPQAYEINAFDQDGNTIRLHISPEAYIPYMVSIRGGDLPIVYLRCDTAEAAKRLFSALVDVVSVDIDGG